LQEQAVRQFTQTIAKVLQRHAPVVVYIAQGILELKRYAWICRYTITMFPFVK
jgi:hypothetical protein